MSIIYKCPFTNKQILEVDVEALKVERIYETPCPYCKTVHPLPICPREYRSLEEDDAND